MRHGSNNQNNNNRRPRGRGHQHGNKRPHHNSGGNRNQSFDSNGPQGRIRGTAKQIHEKYTQMAKDAITVGDHVLVESLFQYADHYGRIAALSAPKPRPEVVEGNTQQTVAAVSSENSETPEVVVVPVVETPTQAKPVPEVEKQDVQAEPEPVKVAEEKPRRRTTRSTTTRRAPRKKVDADTPKLGGGTTAVPDFLARPVDVATESTTASTEENAAPVEEKPKRTRRATTRKTTTPRTRRKKADEEVVAKKDEDQETANA